MTLLDLPRPEALRVAAALWRARGAHVARLVDVRGLGGRVQLVLEDGAVPLEDVLARDLLLGEAVTLLVPLAECVDGLAVAGVAHGAISPGTVRLDVRGSPVLGGFESAQVADDLDEHAGGSADRAAFCALARTVLAAVTGAEAPCGALVADLDSIDPTTRGSLSAFAERLLAAAPPLPVRLGLPARPPEPVPPVVRGSDGVLGRLRRLRGALRSRLGRVRSRFWVPAIAAGLGLAAAVVLLPGADSAEEGMPASGLKTPSPATPRPTDTVPPPRPTGAPTARDPVSAALALRPDARGAAIVDDYGDVVLLELETPAGVETVLIERTEYGWRLRDTMPERS
ncbi:MAG TPA: hypothetical protein VNQ52_08255 [Microbacteriaceae bacterium]|nr:hypothetical protein [Microbacteriaceae bacterium]